MPRPMRQRLQWSAVRNTSKEEAGEDSVVAETVEVAVAVAVASFLRHPRSTTARLHAEEHRRGGNIGNARSNRSNHSNHSIHSNHSSSSSSSSTM